MEMMYFLTLKRIEEHEEKSEQIARQLFVTKTMQKRTTIQVNCTVGIRKRALFAEATEEVSPNKRQTACATKSDGIIVLS